MIRCRYCRKLHVKNAIALREKQKRKFRAIIKGQKEMVKMEREQRESRKAFKTNHATKDERAQVKKKTLGDLLFLLLSADSVAKKSAICQPKGKGATRRGR